MTLRKKLAWLASVAAITSLGVAGPATATTTAGCILTIERQIGSDFYTATVGCTDAATISAFDLKGDDEWPNPDDFIIKIWGSTGTVSGDYLNEDVGARDEIYAKVYYTDFGGKSRTANTNRVDGYFGCVIDPVC
ncbi:hypothetical protein HII36_22005 [Nonomuraea sp. NN258]|uniref:hypothetical protein n=1 Tax=Nonomuraea antri TaxID=2730852 RepID=UPI001569A96F|nr:hypothetical protein [Nonomuraea antri]NRQ34502.1 hypothetical protein [Nonomuraea antri]